MITVCDESQAGHCPVFPGAVKQMHWGFDDPSSFEGTQEEKLEKTRAVRDKIKKKIKEFLQPIFPLDNIPTIWYALSGKGGK